MRQIVVGDKVEITGGVDIKPGCIGYVTSHVGTDYLGDPMYKIYLPLSDTYAVVSNRHVARVPYESQWVSRLFLLFMCALIGLLIYDINLQQKNSLVTKAQNKEVVTDTIYYANDNKHIDALLKSELKKNHVRFADVVIAQARLETGNYTSKVFIENKNLFGMKEPKSRPTTCVGTKNGYALYKSYEDCITDYAIWQSLYCKKAHTEKEYLEYIHGVYSEDLGYVNKILEIKEIRGN